MPCPRGGAFSYERGTPVSQKLQLELRRLEERWADSASNPDEDAEPKGGGGDSWSPPGFTSGSSWSQDASPRLEEKSPRLPSSSVTDHPISLARTPSSSPVSPKSISGVEEASPRAEEKSPRGLLSPPHVEEGLLPTSHLPGPPTVEDASPLHPSRGTTAPAPTPIKEVRVQQIPSHSPRKIITLNPKP